MVEKFICTKDFSDTTGVRFLKDEIYLLYRDTLGYVSRDGYYTPYFKDKNSHNFYMSDKRSDNQWNIDECNLIPLAKYREERINKILNG